MLVVNLRKDTRNLCLRNNTLLPAAWRLSGLEVLGDDGSVLSTHQISNWFARDDSAATRMDKFIVGDQVMQESATQQLVQAMASWSSDGGMLADRHTAMLADTGLQTALAAAWRPAT